MAIKKFINYVVSNDSNKYPYDGLHTDGYYYERIVVAIDIAKLGFTKYEIGKFTPTSDIQEITVNHSLGVIPKLVMSFGNATGTTYLNGQAQLISTEGRSAFSVAKNSWNSVEGFANSYSSTATDNTLKIMGMNSRLFKAGIEYTYLILS